MSDITIKYNAKPIGQLSESGTAKLLTARKKCASNIEVEYVKPKNISVNPDWAQNDATMSDYIKNRPGGYDEIVEIVAFTVTVNKSNTEININNANIDTNEDVIVSINNGDDTTYQWIVEPTETIQVSTGPNHYISAEQTVYHLGTKDLHDTAWENGDWILTHTLTYRQDGVQFRSTRIKASYDTVNPYFVFKQKNQ